MIKPYSVKKLLLLISVLSMTACQRYEQRKESKEKQVIQHPLPQSDANLDSLKRIQQYKRDSINKLR